MTTNPSRSDQERSRAAEQSQLAYLQSQIDELRRQIREQTSKFQHAIEQVRKVEATASQIDQSVERHRHEMIQSLDASRRDIQSLRKDVAGALVKFDELQRPIREMQTQIHQVAEARKQDRDSTAGWLLRIEDLEHHIRDWSAQLNRVDERHRDVVGRFDALYVADETARNEIRKVAEELQVEKQSLRRQIVEGLQSTSGISATLENLTSRIVHAEEVRKSVELFAEQLPPKIAAVDAKVTEFSADIKRIERADNERFLITQERLEDLRHQQDSKVIALQETDDQTQRQLTAWLERVDAAVRALELRLLNAVSRIEEGQREHGTHLSVLEQRDVQLVEALLGALRDRSDRLRTEQVERGTIEPRKGA